MTFLEPWEALNSSQATVFVREIETEVAPEHPLHRIAFRAIARSRGADDVLVEMDDGRVVAVHLTWSSARERPPYPIHRMYDTLDHWVQQVMLPSTQASRANAEAVHDLTQ